MIASLVGRLCVIRFAVTCWRLVCVLLFLLLIYLACCSCWSGCLLLFSWWGSGVSNLGFIVDDWCL